MQSLDAVFSALADPTRRAIVARLAHGEATVTQLVSQFDLTQPTISSHLRVLERAGMITRERVAQTRPCRLNPGGLKALSEWIGEYERFWKGAGARFVKHAESRARKKMEKQNESQP